MDTLRLYHTAVPILLDGRRTAGRISLELYRRYGLGSHWFGQGWSLLLAVYAKRHPLSLAFSAETDGVLIRILCAFADEQRFYGGIPALIPCSNEAVAFLERTRDSLEERFVILGKPADIRDPIRELVRVNEPPPMGKEIT